MVRIGVPDGVKPSEVRRELEAATGRVLQSVAADTRQLVVVCASETEQEELLK